MKYVSRFQPNVEYHIRLSGDRPWDKEKDPGRWKKWGYEGIMVNTVPEASCYNSDLKREEIGLNGGDRVLVKLGDMQHDVIHGMHLGGGDVLKVIHKKREDDPEDKGKICILNKEQGNRPKITSVEPQEASGGTFDRNKSIEMQCMFKCASELLSGTQYINDPELTLEDMAVNVGELSTHLHWNLKKLCEEKDITPEPETGLACKLFEAYGMKPYDESDPLHRKFINHLNAYCGTYNEENSTNLGPFDRLGDVVDDALDDGFVEWFIKFVKPLMETEHDLYPEE